MEFGPFDNKHLVGLQDGKITMLAPPRPNEALTADEAIGLAAWLCLMAGDVDGERVVKAIADCAGKY